MSEVQKSTHDGQKVYGTLFLKVYDFWVLTVCNNWIWRCPTKSIQQKFYNDNFGTKHLDIGVGTGYYSKHADLSPKTRTLTLMDLNPNTLQWALRIIGPEHADKLTTAVHDATLPLPNDPDTGDVAKYDSISLFYLLHCMPGPLSRKAAVFANLKNHLTPDGFIYGTTVVAKGAAVKHNFAGKKLLAALNSQGIFDNYTDSPEGFTEILEEHFEHVEAETIGTVFKFKVSKPKIAAA